MNKSLIFFSYFQTHCIVPLTLALSIFIALLPIPINNFIILCPLLPYGILYFWTINSPSKLNYLAILLFALLKDIYEGSIGINTILFLIFTTLCSSLRKFVFNHSFTIILTGFSIAIATLQIITICINNNENVLILLSQWAITSISYVPLHFFLSKLRTS